MTRRAKTSTFTSMVKAARNAIRGETDLRKASAEALRAAKASRPTGNLTALRARYFRKARLLPLPSRRAGFLPLLVPIFAGLSALGALTGGATAIAKAVQEARAATLELEENKRHNKTMEAIALGRGRGIGIALQPRQNKGFGISLESKN